MECFSKPWQTRDKLNYIAWMELQNLGHLSESWIMNSYNYSNQNKNVFITPSLDLIQNSNIISILH